MTEIKGIHHVTCIAGDPQVNLTFYTALLGMRLVKRTVNQDDPSTYHLFYADAEAHPGTELTFFPWPHLPAWRKGTGLAVEVALAVPPGSLEYWSDRLTRHGVPTRGMEARFDESALPFTDPHGLPLALVETADPRAFAAWSASPVPAAHQIRGIHGVRVWERDLGLTSGFLIDVLGFARFAEEGGWHRFVVTDGNSGCLLDVQALAGERRGAWGVGGVHHVAWRVADEEAQLAVRTRVEAAGRRPTPVIDRYYFKSVYFLEPGGVLFEIATDGPGFAVDEDAEELGKRLVLPPWLEPHRRVIESELPPLASPTGV